MDAPRATGSVPSAVSAGRRSGSAISDGTKYDVYTSLACYLLSEEMAEPAPNVEPVEILPGESQERHENQPSQMFPDLEPGDSSRVISFPRPRSTAADRSRKKKR